MFDLRYCSIIQNDTVNFFCFLLRILISSYIQVPTRVYFVNGNTVDSCNQNQFFYGSGESIPLKWKRVYNSDCARWLRPNYIHAGFRHIFRFDVHIQKE